MRLVGVFRSRRIPHLHDLWVYLISLKEMSGSQACLHSPVQDLWVITQNLNYNTWGLLCANPPVIVQMCWQGVCTACKPAWGALQRSTGNPETRPRWQAWAQSFTGWAQWQSDQVTFLHSSHANSQSHGLGESYNLSAVSFSQESIRSLSFPRLLSGRGKRVCVIANLSFIASAAFVSPHYVCHLAS